MEEKFRNLSRIFGRKVLAAGLFAGMNLFCWAVYMCMPHLDGEAMAGH